MRNWIFRGLPRTYALPVLLFLGLTACRTADTTASASNLKQDYYDLGSFTMPVTTDSPDAQLWFDRGLLLTYGFNHEEAIRCFQRATEADPMCAMAWWGIAHASGPYINGPTMDDAAVERAHQAKTLALANMAGCSELEQEIIAGLRVRFTYPAPQDRRSLDLAYADYMKGLSERFNDSPDVAAQFAESLMVLRPWHYWDYDGTPFSETVEVRNALEKALARHPSHPALCHFYIHLMEASPQPELALPAANALRDAYPESGHLVHMPAHIDIQLGRYADSIEANQKAIAADHLFVRDQGRNNTYTLYRVHNYHFLVYGAMFEGRKQLAVSAARELEREIPAELLSQMPDLLEAFLPTVYHSLIRFGCWEDILQEPLPPETHYYSRAIHYYARTVALAALGRVTEGEKEFELLKAAKKRVPASRVLFENTCDSILEIALRMAEGELEYRRGNYKRAYALLRQGVTLDDGLNYDEPWGWMQPVRHALGALLLEQGHVVEAEKVYREDLERHPQNGWSLHGLSECLKRSNRVQEAKEMAKQFENVWVNADVKLQASCFCRNQKVWNESQTTQR